MTISDEMRPPDSVRTTHVPGPGALQPNEEFPLTVEVKTVLPIPLVTDTRTGSKEVFNIETSRFANRIVSGDCFPLRAR